MTSFKLKQIGLALCLMASLLLGSASACTCSHHEEKAKTPETSCHGSHHETMAEMTDAANDANTVDAGCVCFVNQPTPAVTSKPDSKNLKADKNISNSDQPVPDLAIVGVVSFQHFSPEFDRTLSYSNALRSLLPSRAPPRL